MKLHTLLEWHSMIATISAAMINDLAAAAIANDVGDPGVTYLRQAERRLRRLREALEGLPKNVGEG